MPVLNAETYKPSRLREPTRPGVGTSDLRSWLTVCLKKETSVSRVRLSAISSVIFLAAFGVRLLYWQDAAPDVFLNDTLSQNMALQYRREARRMIEDRSILYPRSPVDPGDARMIIHPPGYSIVMAASFPLFGETESPLRFLQIACDAAAAVLVFFIAGELFPMAVALLAGLFMALSPHASYYSLRLSPDSLAVLPILVAVYLIIRARRQSQVLAITMAGVMLGLSCWLRANALLLAPMLAVVIPVLFERGKRIRYAILLLAAAVAVISPITIRNWVLYHRVIPLALPAGVNLVQGIAEFDREGRFGMPLSDPDVLAKDVEWNNKPEYGGYMWAPDGIERDRIRFDRGMAVVKSHPLWFVSAMLRRAVFMISFNESRRREWPFNTATVPLVSATPPFGRSIPNPGGSEPIWSASPAELLSGGTILSDQAEVTLAATGEMLQVTGGDSQFLDQFVSAPISVPKNTNHLLKLSALVTQGQAAVKVIGPSERVVLGSAILRKQGEDYDRRPRKQAYEIPESGTASVAFASGDANEVRLVLSNDRVISERPVVEVGKVDLYDVGLTPTLWTRYPRVIVRGFERHFYKTSWLLPLIIAGVALLAIARLGRELLILLVVPAYYVVSHAPFSTEYRYILAIHCFLFVMAAVTLYCAGISIRQAAAGVRKWLMRFVRVDV